MAQIIDGKLVSSVTRDEITNEVTSLKNEYGITPGLAVIIVGENPASQVYVRNKHKGCTDVGMYSLQIALPESTTEEELLKKIDELNIEGVVAKVNLDVVTNNEDFDFNNLRDLIEDCEEKAKIVEKNLAKGREVQKNKKIQN